MAKKNTVYQMKYDKNHTVRYSLKLNSKTDKEIIDKIERVTKQLGTKQRAIKYIIEKSDL